MSPSTSTCRRWPAWSTHWAARRERSCGRASSRRRYNDAAGGKWADTSAKGSAMSTMRKIGNVVRAPWDGLVAVLGWVRRRLLTLRGVVLLLLLIIVLLATYYAVSSRHAPFTTDAYVQAYVVQVAARVDGQVVRVHVRENQRIEKDQLLFEIDRRPFEHKVAKLEARLAQVVKQVAQLESQLQA